MLELLRSRRSVRRYTKELLNEGQVAALKEALLRSPSSREIRPWCFYFIENRRTLDALSRAKPHGAAFLRDAALGIIICGETDRSDVWVEDCAIAALIGHLTAHSLGLGSCWIQIRNREHSPDMTADQYVRSVLNLPAGLSVEAVLSVGVPAEHPPGVPAEDLPAEKIITG